jgi:asparagine synthase (glutamine-hydrolysing)
MCGIAGFVGKGTSGDLERMTLAIAHRGPDGFGHWSDDAARVHLGHRRLAIVDLAGGFQPMTTADAELVVTFNGEIYNHAELRRELEQLGHRFQTDHSDTEVLLCGYREWGTAMLGRFNGMWAFALYDRPRRRILLSRDRFGKKPLYYTNSGGAFVFGSELTALTQHPAVSRTLSRRALQKYFGYGYIPAPHTIYEGVHKLPGGCSLWLDIDTLESRVEKYWEYVLDPFTDIPADPEAEWGERLRDLLEKAVQRRLVADVPVGVFLSGGIDSSAVTAFASRHVPAGQLRTFSIGFDEDTFDERIYARRVAQEYRTNHQEEVLSLDKACELLPEIVAKLDEPMGDSSLLPTYLLSGFARRQVTVALGGDGSDELFAGYDPFKALAKADLYRRLTPKPVHEGLRMLLARLPVSHANMSLDFKLKRTLRGLSYPPRLWCPVWMGTIDPAEMKDLFAEPIPVEELYAEAIEAWDACPQTDLIDKTLQFYAKLYLQDDILVKTDRASMMHGLEVRAPFLDIDVVDFVRRIPARYKFRNGQTKYLLKKSLANIVPDEILYRSKKGFGVPIGAWFKSGRLTPDLTCLPASIAREFASEKLRAHRAGESDERAVLWNLYILASWDQTHHASI